MKAVRTVLVTAIVAAALSITPGAAANDDDVIRTGPCSGASDWKLKLSPENGRIEVEFEVDQNVVGDTWRVRLRHNGEVFFTGRRTTQAPSGSFEVRRVTDNLEGTDSFRARGRNLSTDETCVGRARASF
jgi:hypothetical protein